MGLFKFACFGPPEFNLGPFTPSVSINAAMILAMLLSLKPMNRVTPKCVATLFWSDSTVSESSITNIIAELSLTVGVNGP